MARFLVGSTPLMGHVVPVEPIVAALGERGHEVRWYTGKRFRQHVEDTGASFEEMRLAPDLSESPLNEQFPERAGLTGLNHLKFDIKHLFGDPSVGYVHDLQEILRSFPADVLLTDAPFVAGRWLHEIGGLSWAVINPFAVSFRSRDVPPFGLGMKPPASRFGRVEIALLNAIAKRYLYRDTTEHLNRLRRRLGLPADDDVFWDHIVSPYLFLQGSYRGLEYPRSDLPPQFHHVGPLVTQSTPPFNPPDWWPEVQFGTTVIHVTQGTLSNDPEQLLMPAIRALADETALVVVTTGRDDVNHLTESSLPENVRVASFLPYGHLLPHVDLMITNGGYNGVQVALSYGIPLVVAGRTEDKPEVCARVEWSGVGVDLGTESPSEEQIRRAVQQVLHDQRFRERAGEMAAEYRNSNAAVESAELLEVLAKTGESVVAKS